MVRGHLPDEVQGEGPAATRRPRHARTVLYGFLPVETAVPCRIPLADRPAARALAFQTGCRALWLGKHPLNGPGSPAGLDRPARPTY